MGRSDSGTDAYASGTANEQPEHDVTVSEFYLDTYEVTVGRFRKFVEQYDGTPPADGSRSASADSGQRVASSMGQRPAGHASSVAEQPEVHAFGPNVDGHGGSERDATRSIA